MKLVYKDVFQSECLDVKKLIFYTEKECNSINNVIIDWIKRDHWRLLSTYRRDFVDTATERLHDLE